MLMPTSKPIRRYLAASIVLFLLISCAGQTPQLRSRISADSTATIAPLASPVPSTTSISPIPGQPNPTANVILPSENHVALTASPTPTLLPAASLPKRPVAVVIVWDAGQADLVYQAMAAGQLPHFSQLAERGVRAEYAQSVDPSLSAPAQTALISGATPNHTGIVSNAFHRSSDDFYWYRQGFEQPFDQGEPIWVTASQAGLTTAALFIAGATPNLPNQMADYTVGLGIRDAYSRQETIKLAPMDDWQNAPSTYSPALQGAFYIPSVSQVEVLALDSTDDQVANYDTILLNSVAAGGRQAVSNNPVALELGEWGSLTLLPNVTAGADFLIQAISSSEITLYHTGVYHNTAAPRSLLQALNQRFGFFPAGPDDYALQHGWITPDDYLEMLERSSRWMAEVSAWVYETYTPDLLFSWQDGFDAIGHTFLITDPRQPGYNAQSSELSAAALQRAARVADQALEIMLRPIDLESANIVLTADHGIAPVHANVYVNTLLQNAGLLRLDKRNYVDVKRSKALAVASGGSVNIYINLIDEEKDGNVTLEEYPQVQSQVADILRQLSDPDTGQPVFSRILVGEELETVHLDHPNSGDIFAQAVPGYNLDDRRGKGIVFGQPTINGGHGYDSALPEMHVFFIAAGPDLPSGGKTIPPLSILDVAPGLAAWLNFEPGDHVDGSLSPSLLP